MGGAAAEPTSKGGKKSLDAAINLVPYIDLLMTIMTFLMMTEVWSQIAMLEVQNASGGTDTPQDEPKEEKPKPVLVLLTERGIHVQEEGAPDGRDYNVTAEGFDFKGVDVEIQRLKSAKPE